MAKSIGPPPPGLDLNESGVAGALWATFLPWSVMVIVSILRFVCRRLSNIPLWWDDWLIIPAVLLTTAACFATSHMMITDGMGKHIWAVKINHPPLINFWKGLYINQATYAVEIACVKISVLCLYWRLFKLKVRWWLWGLGALTSAWAIGLTVSTFCLCRPLNAFWDKTVEGKCLDQFSYATFSAVPNFVTDLAILTLPIPIIWKLHTSTSHKALLMSIFGFGYFVAGVSIARFVILYRNDNFVSPDITWNSIQGHNWSVIEMSCAVISACLPVLKPLQRFSPSRVYSYLSVSLLRSRSSRSTGDGSKPREDSQSRLHASKYTHWNDQADTNTAKVSAPAMPLHTFDRLPSNEANGHRGVMVESEVDVAWDNAAARRA